MKACSGLPVLFLIVSLMASAASSASLREEEVTRFAASMQELQSMDSYVKAFGEAWKQEMEQRDTPVSVMISDIVAFMRDHDAHDILNQVVRDHGFAGAEAWSRFGDRVMLAVMSLEMGEMAPAMEKEMSGMMAELENNPHFSAEQKARMQRMIGQSAAMMAKVAEVPEADRKAVRPHLGTLKRVMAYDSE